MNLIERFEIISEITNDEEKFAEFIEFVSKCENEQIQEKFLELMFLIMLVYGGEIIKKFQEIDEQREESAGRAKEIDKATREIEIQKLLDKMSKKIYDDDWDKYEKWNTSHYGDTGRKSSEWKADLIKNYEKRI